MESRITNKIHYIMNRRCWKWRQNSACPPAKAKGGGGVPVSGQEGGVGLEGRRTFWGGKNGASWWRSGIHTEVQGKRSPGTTWSCGISASSAAPLCSECCEGTVKIMRVKPKAPQNPTDMHKQQTQEHQQHYFLLSSAWASLVALISVSLEISHGKVPRWHTAILTRSLEFRQWKSL